MNTSTIPLDMLAIDPASDQPAYKQLSDVMREAILDGKFRAGLRLPASRVLAHDLKISRNTVISAYETLTAEGHLETRHGAGTYVAKLPRTAMRIREAQHLTQLPDLSRRGKVMGSQTMRASHWNQTAFYPGYPDLRQFPFAKWARLLNANMKHSASDLIGYSMIGGHPRLQAAIAEYLGAARGMKCTAEQVIVVCGTQAALDLVARLVLDIGDHFWIEEPGYEGAYHAFVGAGGCPVPLEVDASGWHLRDDAIPPRAIFVTPSCQWPTGATMSVEERLRLLELASRHDCWIIEDDYDAEYRFRSRPIPALHGLDRAGRVIYLGTFAKTIFPSLRLGFIVVPDALIEQFTNAVSVTGQYPTQLMQLTLANFIEQGSFTSHLRRMRALYSRRRKYFSELVEEHLSPWIELHPSGAGIQVVAHLAEGLDDGVVKEAAKQRNVHVRRLSPLFRHSQPRQGLICGYAASDEVECRRGIRALSATFRELRPA